MRARAGDPPRTMPQKILAGRASDPQLRGDSISVKVDQIVLSRAPTKALAEALAMGMKKTTVEVAVAYDGTCVTDAASLLDVDERGYASVMPEAPSYHVPVARPGIGYPGPVHLERFAAPARLCLTDDPRLSTVGGIGMLALLVSPAQLGQALATGSITMRPPRSIQIHLAGRVRPFVCARDVALELLRRGLDLAVKRIEAEHKAPVVLEFAGPSVRLLSVPERAVLAGVAPQVGAAAGIFVSDEKTEVFLRDQRRSKAHRALVPDPGAPCEEVVSIDLATVDPLVMDEDGVVRPVRDLAGKPVTQVVLGGDSGTTLRDLLAAAMLLKSKRVPSRLDLLVAPPSRQALEVLAQSGALVDLVATGARVIEPDRRVVTSDVYPPPRGSISMRTSDPEPKGGLDAIGREAPRFVVASAETLAYAVATGFVGDPRSFKRPVRVTVPRALPTDDVLVLRDKEKADKKGDGTAAKKSPAVPEGVRWKDGGPLDLFAGIGRAPSAGAGATDGRVVVLSTLDEVRLLAERPLDRTHVRAVIAPFIPSGYVSLLASEGIAAFQIDPKDVEAIKHEATKGAKSISLPPLAKWSTEIAATAGKAKIALTWLASPAERAWTHAGSSRPAPTPRR
jgi:aconitate hydratase